MAGLRPPGTGVMLPGLIAAFTVGIVLGYLRYWLGFFVIAQGAVLGLLVPWLAVMLQGGQKPVHPGVKTALAVAVLWFAAANLGLLTGFGLAQPWFEPLGWLGRLLDNDTAEFVFGVASNAAYSRGVAFGAQGGFWLLISCIDWAIMFFFFWIMPWSNRGPQKASPGNSEAAA